MKRGKMHLLLLWVMMVMLVLTACGSSSSKSADYNMASPAAEEAAYDTAEYEYDSVATAESGLQETGGSTDNSAIQNNNRKLITTMNMSAETENIQDTMSEVESKVNELGGYVESSNVYNLSMYSPGTARGNRSASYTLRIPSDKLELFISAVEEGTNITYKSVNVEDVTLEYVDVESRKKALKTEENRLLEILEKAETVEDIIAVESKLTDVRYELESVESRLRTYDNLVDYSTVYLDINEVTQYTPARQKGVFERISEGFIYNLKSIGNGITEFFIWVVIHIPQIIILIAVIVIVIAVFRKRAKKK